MSPKSKPATSSHADASNSSDIASVVNSDHRCDCVFTFRALEEVRVALGVQAGRVAEDEVAEVLLGDELLLDELVGLVDDVADVGDVPVADVRPEDGLQASAERVHFGVEGPRVDGIIGLASEVEAVDIETLDVL